MALEKRDSRIFISFLQSLEENASDHSKWEHDLLLLRQALQTSASRDMQYGLGQSAETLSIEAELSQVQQKASELYSRRNDLLREVSNLTEREDFLMRENVCPNPAIGAEVNQKWNTWNESENGQKFKTKRNSKQTTQDASPDDKMFLTLGDISEADERVKKFYGIIPKDINKEVKTVRMVKRDSKERTVGSVSAGSRNSSSISSNEEDSDMMSGASQTRASHGNIHDFFNSSDEGSKPSIPHPPPMPPPPQAVPSANGLPKTNFVLGEYHRKKSSSDRSSSGNLTAHERLFGSKENSISPQFSPKKNGVASGPSSSEQSAIASPVFTSAAAKAIIEEVGKKPSRSNRRMREKKRSFTISGSQPEVMQALQNHEAGNGARSRDDLDMEQALKSPAKDGNTSPPDVVRSAIRKDGTTEIVKATPVSEKLIDNLFGVPDKIIIPERYIPETVST